MKTSEKTIKNFFGKIHSFVTSFTNKNKKHISTRLDARLMEKAKESGVELDLNKTFSPWKIVISLFSGGALLFGVIMVIAFVPGPWTRFFANPESVVISLGGVEYTENGVITNGQKFVFNSPKAIKGLQYVKQNFTITPEVDYKLTLSSDKKQIIVETVKELKPGEIYTFTLESGVLFKDSSYLVNEQSWIVPTKAKFDLVSISPRDGSQGEVDSTIQISFTTDEFELEDVTQYVSIFPKTKGTFSKVSSRLIFSPEKQFTEGGTYTVHISKDLADKYGETLQSDYSSTFDISTRNADDVKVPYFYAMKVFYNHSESNSIIKFNTENITQIKAELYSVSWEQIKPYIDKYVNSHNQFNVDILLSTLDKKKTLKPTVTTAHSDFRRYSLDLSGEKPGIYIVKVYDIKNPAIVFYATSFKSTFGLYGIPKKDKTEMDIWTFSYKDMKHLSGIKVNAASCDGKTCSVVTNTTPEDAHVQISGSNAIDYIYANKGSESLLLFSNSNSDMYMMGRPDIQGSLFAKAIFNKPSYMPSEKLRFSVILRDRDDNGEYIVPKSGRKFSVALCRERIPAFSKDNPNNIDFSRCISKESIKISSDGQINGNMNLWDRREDLYFVLIGNDHEGDEILVTEPISIYEPDNPQTILSIKTDHLYYKGSATVIISGRLTNYVGVGLNRKNVNMNIGFSAVSAKEDIDSQEISLTTDQYGNFLYKYKLPVEEAGAYQYRVYINANYRDGDNYIYNHASVKWDRGDILKTDIYVKDQHVTYVGVGEKPKLIFNAVTLPDGEFIEKDVSIRILRKYDVKIKGAPYYDEETRKTIVPISYSHRTEEVLSKDIHIGKSGQYTYDFGSIKNGDYVINIIESDSSGWSIDMERRLFFGDSGFYYASLDIINEWVSSVSFTQRRVNVGDKAILEIENTFKNKNKRELLLITKVGEVTKWRYIDASTERLEIPVTKKMQGGLEICVVHPTRAYKFKADNSTPEYMGDALKNNCANIAVEDTSKKLAIDLVPSAVEIAPGSSSELKINVHNSAGEGVASTVGVNVVDKSVYDEYYGNSDLDRHVLSLYKDIYEQYTSTYSSALLSTDITYILEMYGGMGAGGDPQNVVRKDFDSNPMWNAALHTDTNGNAKVKIPYSDAITSWVVQVWSVTEDMKVGSEYVEVKTQKDVFVGVDSPKVLRNGDVWKPYIRVVNMRKNDFSGTIEVSCDGCLENTIKENVNVPAMQTRDVVVTSKVTKNGKLPFRVKLISQGRTVDEIEKRINVRPIGFAIPLSISSVIDEDNSEVEFNLPQESILSSSDLKLTLSRVPMLELPNVSSEHGSTVELSQVIMTLTQVSKYSLFEKVGMTKKEVDARISLYASALFNRILVDGSYSFSSYGGTDYDSTIAASYALSALLEIDFIVPSDVVDQSGLYLADIIRSDKVSFEEKGRFASALAFLKNKDSARTIMSLYQVSASKDDLTSTFQSYMAMALQKIGATADATKLVRDISSKYSKDSEGDTKYIEGKDANLLTMMQIYLVKDLGMETIYKTDLYSFQMWVNNRCMTCSGSFEQTLSSFLYLSTYMEYKSDSLVNGEVMISLNKNEPEKIKYNGSLLEHTFSSKYLKIGSNKMDIKTSFSDSVFSKISGQIYVKDIKGDTSVSTSINVFGGINNSNTFSLGSEGNYVVVVSSNKDLPAGVFNISLPSGVRYQNQWLPQYINKKELYVFAYGDPRRSDVLTVSIPALDKGEKAYIVTPFVAVREGTFNGASIFLSFAGGTKINATQGKVVKVK